MTTQGAKVRARLEKRWPKVKEPKPEVMIADGRAWVKVRTARPWRPHQIGDVLIGEYVGLTTRQGQHGNYAVVTVRTETGSFTVAGVVIQSLVEAVDIPKGATVRIVFNGEQTGTTGRTWKDYDLFLAKDEQS